MVKNEGASIKDVLINNSIRGTKYSFDYSIKLTKSKYVYEVGRPREAWSGNGSNMMRGNII